MKHSPGDLPYFEATISGRVRTAFTRLAYQTMIRFLTFLVLCLCAHSVQAQPEVNQITAAVQRYIDGTSLNDSTLILSAFYEDAHLFLSREGQDIWLMPVQEYASGFDRAKRGQPNGRTGVIISVEQQNDIALAKARIELPSRDMTFIDVFILKRLSGEWKIISKAATRIN